MSKTIYRPVEITSDTEAQLHYSIVEAEFLRPLVESLSGCHGRYGRSVPRVLQVEYIVNPKLLQAYEETKKHFEASGKPTAEKFGFHGTQKHAIDKIFEEGFKIGGRDPGVAVQHGSRFGIGVYLATTPTTSDSYNDNSG